MPLSLSQDHRKRGGCDGQNDGQKHTSTEAMPILVFSHTPCSWRSPWPPP